MAKCEFWPQQMRKQHNQQWLHERDEIEKNKKLGSKDLAKI